MAATFSVTDLHGFTEPTGAVIQQISYKESIESYKVRDKSATTVRNIPGKLKTTEMTVEMEGNVALTGVTPGAFTEGELKEVRVRNTQSNEGVPTSTVTLKAYETNS